MKKLFNFRKLGNKLVSTTVEEKPKIFNAIKLNEMIAELRAENELLKQGNTDNTEEGEDISEGTEEEQAAALVELETSLNRQKAQNDKIKSSITTIAKSVSQMSGKAPSNTANVNKPMFDEYQQKEADDNQRRTDGRKNVKGLQIEPQSRLAQMPDKGYKVVNHAAPKAGVAPWFFVDKGYYLGYDKGIAYIQTLKSERAGDLPLILIHSEGGVTNPGTIWQGKSDDKTIVDGKVVAVKPHPYKHLTKAEVDQIVRDKPSVDSITTMYLQLVNKDEVEFELGKAVVIFG
jgi:hypothetical protein